MLCGLFAAKGLVLSALFMLLCWGCWVSGAGFDLGVEGRSKMELGTPVLGKMVSERGEAEVTEVEFENHT